MSRAAERGTSRAGICEMNFIRKYATIEMIKRTATVHPHVIKGHRRSVSAEEGRHDTSTQGPDGEEVRH
jgi:hypothetical protein